MPVPRCPHARHATIAPTCCLQPWTKRDAEAQPQRTHKPLPQPRRPVHSAPNLKIPGFNAGFPHVSAGNSSPHRASPVGSAGGAKSSAPNPLDPEAQAAMLRLLQGSNRRPLKFAASAGGIASPEAASAVLTSLHVLLGNPTGNSSWHGGNMAGSILQQGPSSNPQLTRRQQSHSSGHQHILSRGSYGTSPSTPSSFSRPLSRPQVSIPALNVLPAASGPSGGSGLILHKQSQDDL